MSAAYAQGLKLSSAGRHLEAIACFEQALAVKPDDTATLFALGNTAHALGMAEPAAEFFRKVLALEPERIEALVHLANLLRAQSLFEAARALLEPALGEHPASPELLLTLGSAWRESGDDKMTRAMDHYRAALTVRPSYAPALSNLADLLADEGKFDEARTLYDRAIKAEPGQPQPRLNRAVLNFLTGNLKEGWRDYAARTRIPGKVPACDLKLKEWQGDTLKRAMRLAGARRTGGGRPDDVHEPDARPSGRAPSARAVRLSWNANRGLYLWRRAPFPRRWRGLKTANCSRKANGAVGRRLWLAGQGWRRQQRHLDGLIAALAAQDARLFPQTSRLPHARSWRRAGARGKARSRRWKPKTLTGICWRSGKSGGHRSVQYAPLAAWGEFLRDLPGAIISCQYDAIPEEIVFLEQSSGRKIFVPPALDQRNELDRTAAMLSALDLLVSAPTAVSWLGAGAGVRTLKLLYHNSWTAFGQGHEPFAPACLCIGPQRRGDWGDVFARATALIARS